MKTIIDLNKWDRRENWQFFSDFLNPTVALTCPVSCKGAFEMSKLKGESFFLIYLHAILKSINEIEEMHYRVDKEGNIVRYDRIDVLSPIKVKGREGFVTMRFEYKPELCDFIESAKQTMAEQADSTSYSTENSQTENDLILVSAVPSIPFTAMEFTQRERGGNPYPLIVVGKMTSDYKLPVAASFHHGFVDGEHISRFYSTMDDMLG